MNEQHDKSLTIRNHQSEAQVADSPAQIGGRKPLNNSRYGGSFRRTTPPLLLLWLACVAMLAAEVNWAGAADRVPYGDAYQAHLVSVNGADQVFAGGGTGTQLGKFTNTILVHVGDPAPGSSLLPISGTVTVIAANGDTLVSSFVGFEDLASAPNGGPLHLFGSQVIIGGTGRFAGATGSLTFSGLDYGDGSVSVTTEGTISSVGSNR